MLILCIFYLNALLDHDRILCYYFTYDNTFCAYVCVKKQFLEYIKKICILLTAKRVLQTIVNTQFRFLPYQYLPCDKYIALDFSSGLASQIKETLKWLLSLSLSFSLSLSLSLARSFSLFQPRYLSTRFPSRSSNSSLISASRFHIASPSLLSRFFLSRST